MSGTERYPRVLARRNSARAATTEKHKAEREEQGGLLFGRNFGKTDQWVSQKDPSYCEQIRKQDSTTTDLIDLRKFLEDDDLELELRRGKWEEVVEKQK